MKIIGNLIPALASLIISISAAAEPIVLGDFGGRPTGVPTLETIRQAGGSVDVQAIPRAFNHFPVTTRLTVGVVERRPHEREVTQPIFIVGVDSQSRQWLEANKEALRERGALGLVTAVSNEREVQALQELAPSLRLVAVPVDEIADAFDLQHYPVLIDRKEVVQ